MGARQIFIAIKGTSENVILSFLKLKKLGHQVNCDDVTDAYTAIGAETKNGWYLFLSAYWKFIEDQYLSQLSKDTELIFGVIEEHIPYSATGWWQNGERTWFVEYNANADPNHLDVIGDVPHDLVELKKEYPNNFCEIPMEIFYRTIGYRHDAMPQYLTGCLEKMDALI